MSNYHIYVTNKSANTQIFFLFNELPNSEGISTKAYSNVYASGRPAQPDGTVTQFSVTTDAYACCGVTLLNKDVLVSETDNTNVNLDGTSPNVANMVVIGGGPGFVKSTGGAPAGSFEINVSSYDEIQYRKSSLFVYSLEAADYNYFEQPKFGAGMAKWAHKVMPVPRLSVPVSKLLLASSLLHVGRQTPVPLTPSPRR